MLTGVTGKEKKVHVGMLLTSSKSKEAIRIHVRECGNEEYSSVNETAIPTSVAVLVCSY